MKIIDFLPTKSAILCMVLILPLTLVACDKKAENPAIKNSETTAEQKDVLMSAAPADKKEAPIAVADDGKIKADAVKPLSATEGTVVTTTTKEKTVTATNADPKATKLPASKADVATEEDDEEDNSGMDSISEDDEVVDDSPASPDAPTAKDESPATTATHDKKSHEKANEAKKK